jgi:hypothetical protein
MDGEQDWEGVGIGTGKTRNCSRFVCVIVRAGDAAGADRMHVDVMDGRFSDAAAQEAL